MPKAIQGKGCVLEKAKESSTLKFKNRLSRCDRKRESKQCKKIWWIFFFFLYRALQILQFAMTHTSQGSHRRWNDKVMRLIFMCVIWKRGSVTQQFQPLSAPTSQVSSVTWLIAGLSFECKTANNLQSAHLDILQAKSDRAVSSGFLTIVNDTKETHSYAKSSLRDTHKDLFTQALRGGIIRPSQTSFGFLWAARETAVGYFQAIKNNWCLSELVHTVEWISLVSPKSLEGLLIYVSNFWGDSSGTPLSLSPLGYSRAVFLPSRTLAFTSSCQFPRLKTVPSRKC